MKKVLLFLSILIVCHSCNKESISISGKLNGLENPKIELKLKSKNGAEKVIVSDLTAKSGQFKAYIENHKPPFKLTLVIEDEKEIDFWVFRYGKFNFEVNAKNSTTVKIDYSFENSEYDRVQNNYQKIYLENVKTEIEWVKSHELKKDLSDEDELKLLEYKKKIKKAKRLRKKSILSAVRKSPQNPIAMALFFDEFESLTSWQKEECLKNAQKYFSDSELNWQLRY